MIKTCPVCGKQFESKTSCQKFCSKKCNNKFHRLNYKQNNPMPKNRTCPVCGKQFEPPNGNRKYCSDECRKINVNARYRKWVHKKFDIHVGDVIHCAVCGKEVKIKAGNQKYCSKDCRYVANDIRATEFYRKQHPIVCRKRKPIISTVKPITSSRKKTSNKVHFDNLIKAAADAGLDYGNYKAYINLGYSHQQIKKRFGRCNT